MKGWAYELLDKFGNTVPVIVLDEKNEDTILVAPIIPLTKEYLKSRPNQYFVKIREIQEFSMEHAVLAKKRFLTSPHHLRKPICNLEHLLEKVEDTYNQFLVHSELHQELSVLKKKAELAIMNNQPREDLERRINQILNELGYRRWK